MAVTIKVNRMMHRSRIFFISSPSENTLGARQICNLKVEITHYNDQARGMPGRKVDTFCRRTTSRRLADQWWMWWWRRPTRGLSKVTVNPWTGRAAG